MVVFFPFFFYIDDSDCGTQNMSGVVKSALYVFPDFNGCVVRVPFKLFQRFFRIFDGIKRCNYRQVMTFDNLVDFVFFKIPPVFLEQFSYISDIRVRQPFCFFSSTSFDRGEMLLPVYNLNIRRPIHGYGPLSRSIYSHASCVARVVITRPLNPFAESMGIRPE